MSATRDKNQKTTFVYSNLYELYKKGKVSEAAAPERKLPQGQVLKVEDLKADHSPVAVRPFQPVELIQKRIEKASSELPLRNQELPLYVQKPRAVLSQREQAVSSLQENLRQLNDLHERLKFMLAELEDLTKE